MITKETTYVVTHDDPFAKGFRMYCSKEKRTDRKSDTK